LVLLADGGPEPMRMALWTADGHAGEHETAETKRHPYEHHEDKRLGCCSHLPHRDGHGSSARECGHDGEDDLPPLARLANHRRIEQGFPLNSETEEKDAAKIIGPAPSSH